MLRRGVKKSEKGSNRAFKKSDPMFGSLSFNNLLK
jgi:hypothetical protein